MSGVFCFDLVFCAGVFAGGVIVFGFFSDVGGAITFHYWFSLVTHCFADCWLNVY